MAAEVLGANNDAWVTELDNAQLRDFVSLTSLDAQGDADDADA